MNCITTGLKPLLFVTTASPHLGVSNYGPLPRLPVALTAPLASVFAGKSGRDLFSIDSPKGVVRELATDSAALGALASFRARSAPCNGLFWFSRKPLGGALCPNSVNRHAPVLMMIKIYFMHITHKHTHTQHICIHTLTHTHTLFI